MPDAEYISSAIRSLQLRRFPLMILRISCPALIIAILDTPHRSYEICDSFQFLR